MASASLNVPAILLLLAGVAAFVAWWAYRLRKGIPLRPAWLVLLAAGYLGLFLLVLYEELHLELAGVARFSIALNLSLFAFAYLLGYWHSFDSFTLDRAVDGRRNYRGPLAIPVAWLALFQLRLAVEAALLQGKVYLFSPSRAIGVPLSTYALVLLLVDGLFAASTGLLVGHYLAVYAKNRAQPPSPPAGTLQARQSSGVPPTGR